MEYSTDWDWRLDNATDLVIDKQKIQKEANEMKKFLKVIFRKNLEDKIQ
jgi:hypothetical protein